MLLKIYKILSIILSPLICLWVIIRIFLEKEDKKRFTERFGTPSIPRPTGKVIWIHAASVGESLSALPVINKIIDEYREINIILTTITSTSVARIEKELPERVFHQYIPIDCYCNIKKFFNYWKPKCFILIESEIWPNVIEIAKKNQCNIVLINGRISDKSYQRWMTARRFGLEIFNYLDCCLAQSEIDKQKFQNLGAKNVSYVGNLKFDSKPLTSDADKINEMIEIFSNRRIWVASSLHKGEDEIIIDAHKKLSEKYPDLLTIIIPRHPERSKHIKELVSKSGLASVIRTTNEEVTEKTAIYISDTLGELGIFYRISSIVFVGGSIVKDIGGHNPIEPARLHCSIVSGIYVDNFKEIYDQLKNMKACLMVADKNELIKVIDKLISDENIQASLAENALKFVEEKDNVINKVMSKINPYLI